MVMAEGLSEQKYHGRCFPPRGIRKDPRGLISGRETPPLHPGGCPQDHPPRQAGLRSRGQDRRGPPAALAFRALLTPPPRAGGVGGGVSPRRSERLLAGKRSLGDSSISPIDPLSNPARPLIPLPNNVLPLVFSQVRK